MEHSDVYLSAPQEACDDQSQPGAYSISIPNSPPTKQKKKIEEGEAKKEKVFRNHDFSEGLNYQAGTKQGVDSEPLVHCSSQLVS